MRVAETASVASRIEQAFQSASSSTGTSFDYLLKTAQRESSMNPTAKARTSSATGLFQFIESTWLETLKEAGPKHGLDKFADQIKRTKSGRYYVSNPRAEQEILDLRKDPKVAALMAGALTQKNSDQLSRKIGREPSDGELYMAHFLGATGASRLINAVDSNPDLRADALFGKQARANKPIFYHRNGSPRSMTEVYDVIVSKHDAVNMIATVTGQGGRAPKVSGLTQVATLPTAKPTDNVGVPIARPDLSLFADVQTGEAEQTQVAFANKAAQASEDAPVVDRATRRIASAFKATETVNPFEALFRNDNGSEQVQVNARLTSAFAAVEESAYSRLSNNGSKLAIQELAMAQDGIPLDLTRFLTLDDRWEQRDLLPPA
ncbi:putative lytic transglycosylase [Roseibium sp. TrichSKD4]|uniref:transglycosylase SLT domain-containing protein n=1 Tax=Roseibium sp. TrichSKD4 TaxID=744980 RepID=UPI0001E572BD|nr:transglycosylase SLT domain-containing protein [Roseibium sp. TrichSKD4]EFO29101.1 putative lytic transglycosylase [Roseibium sp. TrichSKD4]